MRGSLHEEVAFELKLGGPEEASTSTTREILFQTEGRAHAKALRLEQPVEYEGGKKKGEKTRDVTAEELAPPYRQHPRDHSEEREVFFCFTWHSCTSLHPQASISPDTFYQQCCDF